MTTSVRTEVEDLLKQLQANVAWANPEMLIGETLIPLLKRVRLALAENALVADALTEVLNAADAGDVTILVELESFEVSEEGDAPNLDALEYGAPVVRLDVLTGEAQDQETVRGADVHDAVVAMARLKGLRCVADREEGADRWAKMDAYTDAIAAGALAHAQDQAAWGAWVESPSEETWNRLFERFQPLAEERVEVYGDSGLPREKLVRWAKKHVKRALDSWNPARTPATQLRAWVVASLDGIHRDVSREQGLPRTTTVGEA